VTDWFGGVKPEHAIAGFGGALAYLPFRAGALKPWIVLGILAAGVATAAFFTPLAVGMLKRFASWELGLQEQFGLAFLLGFTAMVGILPFALAVATWLNTNVAALMARLTGTAPKGGGDAPGP
jgi:glucan phosphoethanolaminetransferase (alkaline phosphatase superfamily)